MKKIYSNKYIHKKTPVIVYFLVQLLVWEITALQKSDFITDVFLWILWGFTVNYF